MHLTHLIAMPQHCCIDSNRQKSWDLPAVLEAITKQLFRCLINNDLALYDYSLTFPSLRKALHPDTVAAALNHFTNSNPHEPLSNTINEIAKALHLSSMQIEKLLIDSGQITINSYRECERVGEITINNNLQDLISRQIPDITLVEDINACRAQVSQLYHVHECDGAEVIFSSDGTGFGKSYGVIQGYVEYLERFAKNRKSDDLFPEGGFTNLLFMSPQKSQIDLDSSQKDKILAAGGEFICVLSRKDIADLDFMDWASGLKTATAIFSGTKVQKVANISAALCVRSIIMFHKLIAVKSS